MLEKAHVGEDVLAKNLSQCDVAAPVNKLSNKESVSCKHCSYPHQSVFCKFKHLSCRKCGIKGHLEKVCQGKPSVVPHCSTRVFLPGFPSNFVTCFCSVTKAKVLLPQG